MFHSNDEREDEKQSSFSYQLSVRISVHRVWARNVTPSPLQIPVEFKFYVKLWSQAFEVFMSTCVYPVPPLEAGCHESRQSKSDVKRNPLHRMEKSHTHSSQWLVCSQQH